MTKDEQRQVAELWHNLFRMHSYASAELKGRADLLLATSWGRLKALIPEGDPEWGVLEKPPTDTDDEEDLLRPIWSGMTEEELERLDEENDPNSWSSILYDDIHYGD